MRTALFLFSLFLLTTYVSLSWGQSCPPAVLSDPWPYAKFTDYGVAFVLNSSALFGKDANGNPVHTLVYENATEVLTLTAIPTTVSAADVNVQTALSLWGFKASAHDWTYDPDSGSAYVKISFDYSGKAEGVPLNRLFFLSLGDSTALGPKGPLPVQIFSHAPTLYNSPDLPKPRLYEARVDFKPFDEAATLKVFSDFFCEHGVMTTCTFLDLNGQFYIRCLENAAPIDECVANIDHCEETCVDGNTPAGGYTCANGAGIRFEIDTFVASFYAAIEKIVPLLAPETHLLGIRHTEREGTDYYHVVIALSDDKLVNQSSVLTEVLNFAKTLLISQATFDKSKLYLYPEGSTLIFGYGTSSKPSSSNSTGDPTGNEKDIVLDASTIGIIVAVIIIIILLIIAVSIGIYVYLRKKDRKQEKDGRI